MRPSDYKRQPAPEFLFERRPLRRWPPVAPQPGEAILVAGNQPAHRATRHEERTIPRGDAPNLTVTSDPNNSIAVVAGTGPDWKLLFWADGSGQTEAQADQRSRNCLLSVAGNTVALSRLDGFDGLDARSELLVEAPHDASVVIHGSYAAVEVRDLAGPVRIAATHARATVLNTSGQVDATAGVVDFAGSCGRITLSAEAEINLKITAPQFDGAVLAWAQRSVRMLVPEGFSTPFKAIVGSRDDFVCRADFRSKVKQKRQGELYVYTYDLSADGRRNHLHLRSEASTVVIDQIRQAQ
jgi:hypothetical protein